MEHKTNKIYWMLGAATVAGLVGVATSFPLNKPDPVPPPRRCTGYLLYDYMVENNLKIKDVTFGLRSTYREIQDFLQGNFRLSPGAGPVLEKETGISAKVWFEHDFEYHMALKKGQPVECVSNKELQKVM